MSVNSLKMGILVLIHWPVAGLGVLEPLNRSWSSKLTPLSWLRFSVSKILQDGQDIFLKRKVVLKVTHL